MSTAQKNYKKLHKLSTEARTLSGITSLLDWDQETYMPEDATAIRGDQLKLLAGLTHEKRTNRAYTHALSKLIDLESGKIIAKDLSEQQQAALREWRRDYNIDKALPKRFVEDFTKLTSQAINAWRHARQNDSFKQFAPYLEKIVAMNRKKAELLGYKNSPYDALLDLFEQGATTKDIAKEFSTLRDSIKSILKNSKNAQNVNDKFLFGNFDREKQIKFSHVLLDAMDYDMKKGRLDFSTHPFSSASHPTDSRITTRIHPTGIMSNIAVVLHEAGHALYEMGLPVEQYGTPLGDCVSLAMHESQSRWWETRIGLSKPFWNHFLPLLKQHFKPQFDNISLDDFYKGINKIHPGFIRVEADEITYSLHVILRFEMERDLIEGKLAVRDVPEAWNAKMTELLGITPKTNQEGCLQDIHWSMGAFGYFPTYTLGNLYAAHMFAGFERDHSDWEKRVSQGDLTFIKKWLNENVHQHGRRYSSKDLLKKITGKPFSADAYIKYLTQKYTS
jgi:carboxypeptidase Taq